MSPLDFLEAHLRGAATIAFPRMELLARDQEPSVVVGAGELKIVSEAVFAYEIQGITPDFPSTVRAIDRLAVDHPDGLDRFRLVMRDADGVDWMGGWTIPQVTIENDIWRFTGRCESLGTHVAGAPREGFSEARYLIPRDHIAAEILKRVLRGAGLRPDGSYRREIQFYGVTITFAFDPEGSVLTLSAPFRPPLMPPFAENWLGEPLRILFGQHIYPRLIGRHFADGGSRLTLRPSPLWTEASDWLAFWNGADRLSNTKGFFAAYTDLLALVVHGAAFEAHPATEYYVHAIQAAQGANWVLAMTLASSVEGLLRLLVPRGTLRSDADAEVLSKLIEHIDTWDGPARIKNTAKDRVQSLDDLSAKRAMYDLADAGVGTRREVDSWLSVRNRVMHGELVSPYTSQRDDGKLEDMANLMRALTAETARRAKLAMEAAQA